MGGGVSLGALLERHRLIVCVGTGGVGKTTLSAALALAGALSGRRAMVLTIDPARALARGLGLERLERGGQRIPEAVLHEAGIEVRGSLSAGMLDQKVAWDAFITRHAPDAKSRRAILDNPFYQELSGRFAGATEYVAVEELCRLDESGDYDLIVLDTPPAAHALDFVSAPARIDRLLDPELSQWLTRPYATVGRSAFRSASATLRFILRRLERATGRQTLRDVSALFTAMDGLFDDIRARTRAARALLYSPSTAFVLVTGPEAPVLAGTSALGERLRDLDVPLRGVIENRTHPLPGLDDPATEIAADALLGALDAPPDVATWLARAHHDAVALARAEARRWNAFAHTLPPGIEQTAVAELDHDLHSLADLADVARRLWM